MVVQIHLSSEALLTSERKGNTGSVSTWLSVDVSKVVAVSDVIL
jgi:hypothetical protein